MATDTLGWPDYLILVLFLVISLGIGVYHSLTGGRQRTTQEFIMANRHLSILPTAMSLMVSFQSALVILGTTAEMYAYGAQYMLMAPIGNCLGILTAERIFVPWIYRLKLVSVNEYLELRYRSRAVRVIGSILGILSGISYMGVAMFGPSAALEAAVGFPLMLSIPLMSVVCIAYTALGGMRAVIWTDVFQFIVMMGGILAILIKGIIVVGGIGEVYRTCAEEGRLQLVNFSFDPTVRHTFWGFIFGFSSLYIFTYGISQASAQRYSATKSLRQARIIVLINIPAVAIMYLILSTVGLTVTAFYARERCDPIANNEVHNPNQLLPHFVNSMFADARGFAGLFLATLYGGALSSVSSSLSGAAANCWEDVLKWKLDGRLSESTKAFINRGLVVVFGIVATGVAFLAARAPGTLPQIGIAFGGSIGGPLVGLFILGGISKTANWKGALLGVAISLVFNSWLNIGSLQMKRHHVTLPPVPVDGCPSNMTSLDDFLADNFTLPVDFSPLENVTLETVHQLPALVGLDRMYSISYVWYVPLGVVLTVVCGYVGSLLLKDKSHEVDFDERLLLSLKDVFTGWKEETAKTATNNNTVETDNKETAQELQPLKLTVGKTSAGDATDTNRRENCCSCCCRGVRSTNGDVITMSSV